jgi:thiopeptide-type bacteriocin biosynthesis protein
MGTAHPGEDTIWIQVNAALFPATAEQPFVPWSALATTVERWRADGYFARFYFVRKPPGLRLRFGGPDLGERLEPALTTWLSAAERRNDIRGFRFTGYEPERRRFGGKTGMGIAHDLFDADAALALRFEAGTASGDQDPPVSRRLLSLAICQDLFTRSLDDGAEVWDVWKGLEEAVGGAAGVPFRPDPAVVGEVRAFLAAPGPAASAVLDPARVANARVSAALRAAVSAGRLSRGPRRWLTAAAVFHWNRWGLPLELPLLGSCVAAMAESTEPDGVRIRP